MRCSHGALLTPWERADDVFCLWHKKTSEQSGLCSDVVRVARLELAASSSQTCVGTFKRHSAALFGPFRRSGNSSLTLLCPACFKQNFLLLGWVWDWILYIKKVPPRANDDSGPDRNREGAENAPHKQRIAAFACGGGTAAVSCHGNDKND